MFLRYRSLSLNCRKSYRRNDIIYRAASGEVVTGLIKTLENCDRFALTQTLSDLVTDITCIKIALGVKSKENIEISEMKLLKRGGDYYPLLLERSYHIDPLSDSDFKYMFDAGTRKKDYIKKKE